MSSPSPAPASFAESERDSVAVDPLPHHTTRKSHHSLERDRIKHSGKPHRLTPRKDGFGKGNVGVLADELESATDKLDPRDPDFEDPRDEQCAEQPKPASQQ